MWGAGILSEVSAFRPNVPLWSQFLKELTPSLADQEGELKSGCTESAQENNGLTNHDPAD